MIQAERERELAARTRTRLGSRHARAVRAPRRQVVLLHRRRIGVPRLPRRRRRRDRLGRSRRASGPRPRAGRALRRTRTLARLADRDPRRVRSVGCRSTPRTGCTRSTTATRRSSTQRRSRSRGARSERCASRCIDSSNAGYTARALRPSEIPAGMREELESRSPTSGAATSPSVDSRWRSTRCSRSTTSTPSSSSASRRTDRAAGFLHFALSPASRSLSLSSMPRSALDTERLQRVADLRSRRLGP